MPSRLTGDYDVVVIGPGHNALILSAYLGRSGLRVLAVDRAAVAGGGLATVQAPRHPGFLHNTHAFFQRAITAMPWYADLDLERLGARYIEPELNVALITRDGRALEWWTDIEKTIGSGGAVQQAGRRHAAALARRIRPDRPRHSRSRASFAAAAASRTPGAAGTYGSGPPVARRERPFALEFVQREFEHTTVQAGLLFFNGLREVDLRERGFGHHIAALIASPAKAQMSRGGSAALARALVTAVRAAGGDIRLMTEPARIVVENGRALGIETRDGELIRARQLVASSLNPHQTYLELLDPSVVPGEIRQRAERFRYNLLAPLFALHVNLHEPPRYLAAANHPELARAFMTDRRPRPPRSVLRHHSSSRGRDDPADRDVGGVSDAVRRYAGAAGKAHGVHVGEGAVPARGRCGELGSSGGGPRPPDPRPLAALRTEPARRGD
jgi:phytoene dehydrogenase-like protein